MMSRSEAGKLGWLKSKPYWDGLKQANLTQYNLTPSKCEKCQLVLSYEKRTQRYCSSSCAVSVSNITRAGVVLCLYCNKRTQTKKFCSHDCRVEYNLQIAIEGSENDLKPASATTYRNYLLRLHGPKCMKCGWNQIHPKTGKVPIQLNHIDGNAEHNKLSNLELLCPNCHSLTPTFGALNIGNGRRKRRERYQENKKPLA